MTDVAGTISALWRFPVKSMLGEQLDSVDVTEAGIAGDRAYGIIDTQTGKVASAKHPKLWPDLLACRATFTQPPVPGAEPPPARIELADGTIVATDDPDVDTALSRFFGREVALSRASPADYTIDEYVPEGARPDQSGDRVAEQKLGAALFSERGLPSFLPDGSFMDLFPLSVMTTSTIAHLEQLQPSSRFDARRFRMNVIIDTPATGFAENDWIGRILEIGDSAQLAVVLPDPRCVMTNLAQEDLPRDPKILKTLGQHNRLDVAGTGLYPCAGVYATTATVGTIRTGDRVALLATH
jgi:uncharacterized protein YcbX